MTRFPFASGSIDPELAIALERLPQVDLDEGNLADWRELQPQALPAMMPPPAPVLQRHTIAGLPGEPDVPIILIDPQPNGRDRGAYVYLHGGGYVLFDAARNPALLQRIAMEIGCLVVAVDYRLAPEFLSRRP